MANYVLRHFIKFLEMITKKESGASLKKTALTIFIAKCMKSLLNIS